MLTEETIIKLDVDTAIVYWSMVLVLLTSCTTL